jgi:hypothetical protein
MAWYATPTGNPGVTGPRLPKPARPKLPPKPKPPVRPKPPPDPFAPLSDAQLQSQASAQVQALIGPIIQQIKDAFAQRSAAGSQAITGYTNALAGLLGKAGPQTAAAYQEAEGAQSAANNALANRLSSFGSNLAAQQGNQLASINAPASTAATEAQTQTTGQGASNANFARGNAELGNLISHGAAQQGFNASLPGIAALTGLQNMKQFQAQLSNELNTQLTAAQTNAAAEIARTFMSLKQLELQKAVAKATYGTNQAKLQLDTQYKQALINYHLAVAKWNRQAKTASLKIQQQNANTAAGRAQTAASNAAQNNSRQNSRYYTDSKGRKVPAGYEYNAKGQLVKIPTGKSKGGVWQLPKP